MSNGVPVDVIGTYSNEEVAYEEWNKLTEKQKLEKSPIYGKVRRHDDSLIALVETRVNRAIESLVCRMSQVYLLSLTNLRYRPLF